MRSTVRLFNVFIFVASTFVLLGAACSSPTETPDVVVQSTPTANRDSDCPLGHEYASGGCVPVRPTVYPHIQLASALIRDYVDFMEIDWRAAHYDLLIGRTASYADRLRAGNPNVRLFEYATFRYDVYAEDAEDWAADNGYSAENFFIHYRQDVNVPGYESIELVPGFPAGFVPGWNPNAGPGDPPATATEIAQSRNLGIYEGGHIPWHMANITDPGYRAYLTDRMDRLMDGSLYGAANFSGPIDGVMIDHGVYYPQFGEGMLDKTVEFYQVPIDDSHPYAIGFLSFYVELVDALSNRLGQPVDIMPNFGHSYWLNREDPLSQGMLAAMDWAWPEVWITFRAFSTPTSGSSRVISYESDYVSAVANIVRQTLAGGRRILGARDLSSMPAGSPRGKLYTLALYYLVHNPNTFYMYESFTGHYYRENMALWQWNPAVVYDIGQPAPIPAGKMDFDGNTGTSEHFEFASGADPYDPSLTYHLFARTFTGGMVLVKMLPKGSVVDDQSVTVHQLDRPYKILQSDGTVGSETVTEVSIRNNEGVILVLP